MIKLAGVTKNFGDRCVLENVQFEFADDTIYFLRGPSGVGKSTVLNLIAGYLEPDHGSITCTSTVGYLMQDELLFSELTVVDNLRIRLLGVSMDSRSVGLSSEEIDRRIAGALQTVGLLEVLEARVANLSGGERRRVELSALLLTDPAALLLDEPAANLDAASANLVYTALWNIQPGRTIIVVTHESDIQTEPADSRLVQLIERKLHHGSR